MIRKHYDATVLLGGGINLDGTLPDTSRAIVEKAAWLYKQHETDAIIVCGSHGYKAEQAPVITEAEAYANLLEDLGVPRKDIYLEAASQETLGNILFAKMHILLQQDWRTLLVIPSINHSTERVSYLLKKILGDKYAWEVLRVGENRDEANRLREAKSLKHTQDINDKFADGDHDAIYQGLMETHPAYGGTKWTVDELRQELGS